MLPCPLHCTPLHSTALHSAAIRALRQKHRPKLQQEFDAIEELRRQARQEETERKGAKASGDRQLIERISVAANGGTITIRLGSGGWGEAFRSDAAAPPVITLTTPRLTTISVSAGARVTVNRIAGQRIDLSVAGSSSLTAGQVEADQLTAALLGSGALTVGGRVKRARLTSDGTGTIDAKAMTVDDLVVQLNGLGETRATAQRTAQVTTMGLGQVTVEGGAACTVRALAGGPVSCGTQRPR